MPERECQHLVLVIEDEDNIAAALEYVIEQGGYNYARAVDGVHAVETIRTMRPTVVLLDVMLPGRSGFDVCREVRKDKLLNGVRIVMMTARGSAQEQAYSIKIGADAFLPKPFELGKLRDTIRQQISLASI